MLTGRISIFEKLRAQATSSPFQTPSSKEAPNSKLRNRPARRWPPHLFLGFGVWDLNFSGAWGWRQKRTAPDANHAKQFFTVTHPFHPWRGRRFELIDCECRWGQWRVFYVNEEGSLAYLPASWTDASAKDPFVEQARGRAVARLEDLLKLAEMVSGKRKW